MPGSVGAVLVERPASIEEVFCFSLIQVDLTRFFNRVSARTLQLFITTVTRLLVPTMSYTTSSCPGVLLFFECRLLHSDVYSSVYSYIHIYKKLPFLADFIKSWVHFIKNSEVISLVIYQSQPKLHWTIRYKALWKYICIETGTENTTHRRR